MYEDEQAFTWDFMDQDAAVSQALQQVDRGLFDADDGRDEDLAALLEN